MDGRTVVVSGTDGRSALAAGGSGHAALASGTASRTVLASGTGGPIDPEPLAGLAGLAAVLFDMDGLLVDTEPIWLAVEHEVMARLGATWSPKDQAALVGGPIENTVAYMIEVAGTGEPGDVERWLLAGMSAHLASDPVPVKPGAGELLDALAADGVPTALVSSSFRAQVDAVLRIVGRERFPVSVAGDEVARRKPDPEGYLTAARLLGVDPARCVVLEDSANGARAGEAAGCLVVVVPSVAEAGGQQGRVVRESLAGVTPQWLAARLAART